MFQTAQNQYYTPFLEAGVVKMATNGLNYDVRKMLINQQFLDLS